MTQKSAFELLKEKIGSKLVIASPGQVPIPIKTKNDSMQLLENNMEMRPQYATKRQRKTKYSYKKISGEEDEVESFFNINRERNDNTNKSIKKRHTKRDNKSRAKSRCLTFIGNLQPLNQSGNKEKLLDDYINQLTTNNSNTNNISNKRSSNIKSLLDDVSNIKHMDSDSDENKYTSYNHEKNYKSIKSDLQSETEKTSFVISNSSKKYRNSKRGMPNSEDEDYNLACENNSKKTFFYKTEKIPRDDKSYTITSSEEKSNASYIIEPYENTQEIVPASINWETDESHYDWVNRQDENGSNCSYTIHKGNASYIVSSNNNSWTNSEKSDFENASNIEYTDKDINRIHSHELTESSVYQDYQNDIASNDETMNSKSVIDKSFKLVLDSDTNINSKIKINDQFEKDFHENYRGQDEDMSNGINKKIKNDISNFYASDSENKLQDNSQNEYHLLAQEIVENKEKYSQNINQLLSNHVPYDKSTFTLPDIEMKNSYMEPENLINFDDSVNYTQKENENYQKLQNETFSPKEVNDTSGKWKNLCVQKKNANMPRQSILTRFDPMYVDENKTETSSSIKDGSANTSSIIDRYSSLDLEASKLDNSINDLTQQEKIPNIVENQYTTFELNNTRQISNESDSISSKNGSSGVMITPVLKYSENDFNNLKKKLKCDFEKEKEIIDQEWLAKIKISKKKLSEVSGKAKSNQKQSNELQKMVNEFEQISTELSEKFNKCQHQHDRLIKERERIVKSLLTGQDYLKMLNERCIKLRENINCTQKEAQEKFDLISIQHENMINLYNRKNDELSQLFNLKIKYENDCQQNTIKSNIENARFEAILKKHDIELQSLKITINQKMQKLNSLNSLCEDVLNSRSR